MSNSIINNLITKVGCDCTGLLAGFEKSKSATRSYASDVGAIAAGGLIASGIEAGLSMLKSLGQAVFQAADDMDRLATAAGDFGVSITSMQNMEFAAKAANLQVQDLEKYMRKAGMALVDKPQVFEKLGLDAQKLTSLGMDKQFEVIRDKLSEIQNINDRMNMAGEVFGKGGEKALNVDMGDARKSMADTGGAIDEQAVMRLKAFADEFDKVWLGIKNLSVKVLALFADMGRGVMYVIEEIVAGVSFLVNGIEKVYQFFAGKSEIPPIVPKESNEAVLKLAEDIDTLTAKLEAEKATMGMSSQQAEIWSLKKRGATEAQLANIIALEKSNEAVKKGIEAEKRMTEEIKKQAEEREKQLAQRAKAITADNLTPEEKFKDSMGELNNMIEEGRISWETYDRAARKAAGTLGKEITSNASANYAVEYGSSRMYDLLAKLLAEKEQKEYQDKLLKQAEIQNDRLLQIVENTGQAPQVASVN